MDPVDRILVSRRFDTCQLEEWMLQRYLTLCERTDPISVQEAQRLNSVETVALLAIARERVQNSIGSYGKDTRTAGKGGQRAASERLPHEVVADVFNLGRSLYDH
jgi:hypothetical protein